ncbi:MAG: S1 family peptidase [Gaiellaceae bacterium]
MPLPLDMLESVVRITTFGDLLGTGFVVRVASETGHGSHSYLVTAHHVIRHQTGIHVELAIPDSNGALYPAAPIDSKRWRQPLKDVDLAVAYYTEGEEQFHHGTWAHAIGVPDLGGHIYYGGIFEPLDRPMARSGTIGAIEQEGIRHSNGAYTFPAHLVDCRGYLGFSGSPCWVEAAFAAPGKDVPPWIPDEDRPLAPMHYYTLLCGLLTAHFSDEKTDDAKGVISRYGVGIMLPGRFIWEALMTDESRQERLKVDEQRASRKRQPPLEDMGGGADEFSRFEDLTRKLVNTPKPKPDEDES